MCCRRPSLRISFRQGGHRIEEPMFERVENVTDWFIVAAPFVCCQFLRYVGFASENLPTAGRDVEVSRTGQPTFFFSRNGLSSFMCGVFLPTYTIPWYPISAKPIHQNQKDMTSRWDRTNPCTARWTSSRAPWRRSQAASDEVLHVHCDASSSA